MNAALYARVSTSDQNCSLQLQELRAYAARMGWDVYKEYSETISGSAHIRPALERLMADAFRRRVDVVLVSKLDRFGRTVLDLNQNLALLASSGVRFIATSQGVDTADSNPMSRLMVHMLAAFAEFEHTMILERVKSGQDAAWKKGKHCGRPARVFRRDIAQSMRAEGKSWRQIGKELGIPVSTVRAAVCRKPDGKGGLSS